ncbi:MAG: exodeoxyribonuclease VII small subunit [Candidatus Caldatribacteriota bacterium]|nr:exodeoxyribonuclease VII small subunit [Candidatus Caldatribacteriota bacterium]
MKKKKKIENIPFEEYLRKLEKIVNQLEEGELTLDESVRIYEEGMNISKICLEKLNKTKKKIEQLVIEGEEKYSTKSFSEKEGEDTINEF